MRLAKKLGVGHGDPSGQRTLPHLLHTKWGLFPITVLVFSLVFLLSSTIPIERSHAEELYNSVKESMSFSSPLDIFTHNISISIIMMTPVLGFLFSIVSSSTTGVIVSAVSSLTNLNPLSLAVELISSPPGILEFLAYGLASAQSLAGLFAMVEKRMKTELRGYLTTLLITSALLLAAAFLETTLMLES
ncbi:MAG: stage II sporulation protein M [Thermoproteota archaeon]